MDADDRLLTDQEFARQYEDAARRGGERASRPMRALSAHYDRGTGRVMVELGNGCVFGFPSELGQGLEGATPDQLEDVQVSPAGDGLHWESLDADLHVDFVMRGIFGNSRWMAELGRAGGRVKSAAKARAARANGQKGGRPRGSSKGGRSPG